MKSLLTTAAALAAVSAAPAFALGLDRSNQDIGILFEEGGYAELSFGMVTPDLEGTDLLTNPTGNVGLDFNTVGLGVKMDVTPQISFAVILDEPFGANVEYEGSPATTLLGGTAAELNSTAFTAVGRYQFNDNFSVHAGVRRVSMDADVTLSGQAYGGLSGYNVALENGEGTGWLAGVAYERPDIALRVALTYNSEITNTFDGTETINGIPISALPPAANPFGHDGIGEIEVVAPAAWNLDFQTGIAANTLLFGQIRYAEYSSTILSPEYFDSVVGIGSAGDSITDIEDGTSYSVGVGRRFTDEWAGQVSVGYEAASDDDLVSPLSPTNGQYSLSVGGSYTMDNVVISGGVRYTMLGDAFAETGTPDAARAEFSDSSALAVGLSVGFRF